MFETEFVVAQAVAWAILVLLAIFCAKQRAAGLFLVGSGMLAVAAVIGLLLLDSDARPAIVLSYAVAVSVAWTLYALPLALLVRAQARAWIIVLTTSPIFAVLAAASPFLLVISMCFVGGHCVS